jgi:hypothetical protein
MLIAARRLPSLEMAKSAQCLGAQSRDGWPADATMACSRSATASQQLNKQLQSSTIPPAHGSSVWNPLQVIQLEPTTNLAAKAAAGAPAAQPQSQNLEGHSGSIICSSWNHPYMKVTTSDENGLIIVWVYTDTGDWVEEMVNNR